MVSRTLFFSLVSFLRLGRTTGQNPLQRSPMAMGWSAFLQWDGLAAASGTCNLSSGSGKTRMQFSELDTTEKTGYQ